MRRLLSGVAVLVIAVAGVFGLIAFLNGRDGSTAGGSEQTPVPGVTASAGGGALLRSGNVELTYSDPRFSRALHILTATLGAPDSPELRNAGQAVVVRRDPKVGGVVARAWGHTLTVASPADSRLQDFIESWLGRGASG